MHKGNFDEFSEDQDEYFKQEKEIANMINRYRDKKKPNIQKQIKNAFFQYQELLQSNYASPAKWEWLKEKKAELYSLKNQKATQNQQKNAKDFFTVTDAKLLQDQTAKAMVDMAKNLQAAIDQSTYIKIQLNKQIQNLDRVYQINKDTDTRIKRGIDGLRTMLRRIMMSKLTRFLSVLTVLAIIALIVVYILKSNGIIQ